MNPEDAPPTDEELRDAELLARSLEGRADRDLAPVDDALGVAWMLRASQDLELSELRARAVRERSWQGRRFRLPRRIAAIVAIAAAAMVAFVMLRAQAPANLPGPSAALLRAQIAAARGGADLDFARFEEERARYRGEVYAALRRAYGARR